MRISDWSSDVCSSDLAHMASIRSVESSSTAAEGGAFVLWLSSTSRDVSFRAPDLNSMGFRLIEGHVLQAADMPTAQLVSRDSDENIVTLYFVAMVDSSENAPTFLEIGRASFREIFFQFISWVSSF